MNFNIKESLPINTICKDFNLTPIETVELIAKNGLTLWTYYEPNWIKINTLDLNHITTKATKVFQLEGTYKTSCGKEVKIDYLDVPFSREDKNRKIETLRLHQRDLTSLIEGTKNHNLDLKPLVAQVDLSKSNSKNIGKHWSEKREALLSAILYQINSALYDNDSSIFKDRKGKKSLNMERIAQRVVDHGLAMSHTESFDENMSVERIKDVLRAAINP